MFFKAAFESQFLIYTNERLGQIRGVSLDQTSTVEIIPPIDNLEQPVALDYDRQEQYIYYSDTKKNVIGRQKLDASEGDVAFISAGL